MMSFIVSNLATDNRTINIDQDGSVGYINIDTYMREMGFTPIETIDLYGGKAKCYTGVKEIQYYDIKKYVYCAFVGGFTDIESYVDLLYNDDGSEEEKFKEIADIIYDKLQNYTKNGEYCYWISGMNIAGGVANLLACELKGEECYAYIMDPPNISRIDNSSYNYIMNIINTDNLIPKIYKDTRNHINGKRYYNSIRYDLMSVYRKYNNNTSYYKGDFKIANRIKEDIQEAKDNISDGEVHKEYFTKLTEELYGELLTNSSSYLYNNGNIVKTIDKNGEEHIHENITEIDRVYAMNVIGPGAEFSLNPVYSQNFKDSAKTSGEARNNPVLIASVDLFAPINIDHDTEIAEKGNTERNQTDEEKELNDFRNGYRFNGNSDYEISDEDYNNSEEDAVMIKPFMYSNYTIKPEREYDENGKVKKTNYKDINYAKFWCDDNGDVPTNKEGEVEQLYKYQAGNMSEKTSCSYGNYEKSIKVQNYFKNNNFDEDKTNDLMIDSRLSLENNNYLVTINNRIIAAFPSALFSENFENGSEFNKSREIMNLWERYDVDAINDDGTSGGSFGGASITGHDRDIYRLVDVVIEDDNNQQFVVPFIVIDTKKMHLLPNYYNIEENYYNGVSTMGMYSTLTDNRYGQVMEYMVYDNEHPLESKTYTNGVGKDITYYSRDQERKATYISAIEPYIYIGGNKTNLNKKITNLICGNGATTNDNKCKIVSMRIYNERCAKDDGTLDKSGTWNSRQKKIKENTDSKKAEIKKKYKDILEYYNDKQFEIIVNY